VPRLESGPAEILHAPRDTAPPASVRTGVRRSKSPLASGRAEAISSVETGWRTPAGCRGPDAVSTSTTSCPAVVRPIPVGGFHSSLAATRRAGAPAAPIRDASRPVPAERGQHDRLRPATANRDRAHAPAEPAIASWRIRARAWPRPREASSSLKLARIAARKGEDKARIHAMAAVPPGSPAAGSRGSPEREEAEDTFRATTPKTNTRLSRRGLSSGSIARRCAVHRHPGHLGVLASIWWMVAIGSRRPAGIDPDL